MLLWCLGGLQGLDGFGSEGVGVEFGEENWTGILFSTWIVPDPDAEEVPRPPVCCRCSLRWFVNP